MSDCGEQTGADADRHRDLPICVGVESTMNDGRIIKAALSVGTIKNGLPRTLGTYYCIVKQGDKIFSVNELSKLQKLLKATQ